MTEMDLVMMLRWYATGFLSGGVFWYAMDKRRVEKKNCERNNRIMCWRSDNPELNKAKNE